MTTKDWRDLPAGRELDRVVAERLGLKVMDYARDYVGVDDAPPDPVIAPDDPDGLWAARPVKTYSTSVDAALTLPIGDGMVWRLSFFPPDWAEAQLQNRDYQSWSESAISENASALAIVRAWLSWREASDDR